METELIEVGAKFLFVYKKTIQSHRQIFTVYSIDQNFWSTNIKELPEARDKIAALIKDGKTNKRFTSYA